MKNLLLLFIITLLLSFSANAQEPVNPDHGSVDPILKELYIKMIRSESHKNFDKASKAFTDKMGDEIPDDKLSSEGEMLDWIKNNILLTNFDSYQEAVREWNNVIALSSISVNANMAFHEYLAEAEPGAFLEVLMEVDSFISSCAGATN